MGPKPPPIAYRLLSIALFPLWCLHAIWHALQYSELPYIWKRLALDRPTKQRPIWFHAASVGETELIKPLVGELLDYPIVVTTFTASGYRHARKILPKPVRVMVLPIDFWPISRWFIRANRFRLGLIGETELWPETLYQAASAGVPLLQVNARISDKTDRTPAWIRRIHCTTLSYFTRQLARTDKDRERFIALGADPQAIEVCGNLKYAGNHTDEEYQRRIERPYLLFASTHATEELAFAKLYQALGCNRLAVIAPRHPQRAGSIIRELSPLGLDISRRSKDEPITAETDIYLADTLGELKAFMAYADIVVMGGSFDETGGHNLLEPARLGCTIITGPSDHGIRADIDYLTDHEAIIQVTSLKELESQLDQLLQQPQELSRRGNNARMAMQQSAEVLDGYLSQIRSNLAPIATH